MTDAPFKPPTSDEDLKLIGEICVLQGQIEFLMQDSAGRTLGVGLELAREMLGSTNLQQNLQVWLDVLYEKRIVQKHVSLDRAEILLERISELIRGRNDFIHGVFGYQTDAEWNGEQHQFFSLRTLEQMPGPVSQRPVVMRSRTGKMTGVDKLKDVRDAAAEIATIMAHIHFQVWQHAKSPWAEALGEAPEPKSAEARARLAGTTSRRGHYYP